jgi:hypothetical protein
VTGAVLFAAAGAWLLATAGSVPAYTEVVLPSMLPWGMANAPIQPSLFASAAQPTMTAVMCPDEQGRACSRSAVSMPRQKSWYSPTPVQVRWRDLNPEPAD